MQCVAWSVRHGAQQLSSERFKGEAQWRIGLHGKQQVAAVLHLRLGRTNESAESQAVKGCHSGRSHPSGLTSLNAPSRVTTTSCNDAVAGTVARLVSDKLSRVIS